MYIPAMLNRIFLVGAVEPLYNTTIGSTTTYCYNQVVVVTSTFCTEASETVPSMCVVVERVMCQVTL